MGAEGGDRMPESQLEPSTWLTCKQCQADYQPRNRNGVKSEFCKPQCRTAWHNAQRLKGAALLKTKKKAVQGPRAASIRTLDQLSAAEGLPSGCFSAGSLGRLVGRPASESTLVDLVSAAKRIGLTEEGETVKAARLAAHQTAGTGAAA